MEACISLSTMLHGNNVGRPHIIFCLSSSFQIWIHIAQITLQLSTWDPLMSYQYRIAKSLTELIGLFGPCNRRYPIFF
jgi:hypothetical protein